MGTSMTNPMRLPMVLPSILSADFADMGSECEGVLAGAEGADGLHLDVMDGHFVPNLTMGPDMCRALARRLPGVLLDVHLMITDPADYAMRFVEAGAGNVTFHVEVVEPDEARALAERIRAGGATAGIAINPPTPIERLLPVLEVPDLVLVMSVNPGFGGQSFMPEVLRKVERVRSERGDGVRVELDGGISATTAPEVLEAGGDVLVAGSAVFGAPRNERLGAIRALRGG